MKVADFTRGRNVENQAITRYINRHPELFDGHVMKDGREIVLDDVALDILNEKYPLPQPIQIVEDTEARRQLIEAQQMIIKLQQQLVEAAPIIALAEHNQYLISQMQQENEDLKSENAHLKETEVKLKADNEFLQRTQLLCKTYEKSLQEYDTLIKTTEDSLHMAEQRAEKLQEELDAERNKSWFQKLLGK